MPSLRVMLPGQGPKVFHLYKKITAIGQGEENDISLPDPLLDDAHAHIHFDGRDFYVTAIDKHGDLHVNGRRRKKHKLIHDDTLRIGSTELTFSLYDEPVSDGEAAKTMETLNGYRKLLEFSEQLLVNYDIAGILNTLMDTVIAITNADKGFLILLEGGELRVKVARNLKRENLADALSHLSDSIIDKVVRTRKPLIVSDAMRDAEFQNAMSVMNLRLSSVMCVPLLERGNLLGVIYVGNDSVADLFDPTTLEVLTIFAAQASLLLRNALLVNELQLDNKLLVERLEHMRFGAIIGTCPAMQEVFKKVSKIANTDIAVLITGETGTGKELIALEVHQRSARNRGPFVTINCGAIPENLLESELFGHVKGAFTGAVANKPGKFQAADGGTLFLDEIGEMPLQLQVKLLRALQDKTVVRVGDTRPETVDIRILAATNRDLETEIAAGRFREDLYWRLNVVNIHLPPLRERGEDVMMIAKYFMNRFITEFGSKVKGFSPNAVIAIRKYPWPGNIRQLENHLKKAVVMTEKALVGPEDLGLSPEVLPPILPLAEAKERFQRQYINEVLELNNGNRTKTARDLGVDPRTIFRHLEREDGSVPPEEL
ncbi:MAG TPA: sigma 54-interacting transcriptional regulator [Polyangia bacterium]|jgi:transcriptional regulator with GAF, ATPase, and Fis domain|nr:sigma 54-interacting transcriptional regulator [Polyangia bacterium]